MFHDAWQQLELLARDRIRDQQAKVTLLLSMPLKSLVSYGYLLC